MRSGECLGHCSHNGNDTLPFKVITPATGTYIGPDGHEYTQSDLAQTAPKDKSWQTMLLPPGN